jgi:uncharacterized protein (TIGR02996 family)
MSAGKRFVSDDEAFIRRIVAGPGDDTPRLVYADWLDERNDPRGAYLRAELAWAALEPRPAAPRKLRSLAADLDPVWVARVSRPPVGVCCDHLTFQLGGPRLTAEHLDDLERRLGVPLPPDYRGFLLTYNGGMPTPADVPGDVNELYIEQFHTASRRPSRRPVDESDDVEVHARWFWAQDPEFGDEAANRATRRLAAAMLPVGMANGQYLFLVVRGPRAGRVGICDAGDCELHEMRVVARSFAALLGSITETETEG